MVYGQVSEPLLPAPKGWSLWMVTVLWLPLLLPLARSRREWYLGLVNGCREWPPHALTGPGEMATPQVAQSPYGGTPFTVALNGQTDSHEMNPAPRREQ